jgi:hypothetical protein
MKRYGNLCEGMIAFDNLLRAAGRARRGHGSMHLIESL